MSTDSCKAVSKSDWIQSTISAERFKTYLTAMDGNLTGALSLYALNLEASSEMFQWLGFLEVTLRNSLIGSLTPACTDPEFDPIISIWNELTPSARASYNDAAKRLLTKGKKVSANGLITELPFGFWRFMLSSRGCRLWQ